jgi:hypothetical protein
MIDSTSSSTVRPLYRATQVIWYLLYTLETLLAFRFLLKLIGANPAAGFSRFIYGITYVFAEPFLNVVPSVQVEGSVFEWTTLLAMLVYWLVAWGIIKLLVMGKPVSRIEAEVKLDAQDK